MRKNRLLIGRSLDDCCRNRGMTIKKYVLQKIGMTILFYLLSTTAHAECTPAPDCAELGYTADSCEGKFVRCPFNTSKLFCLPCDSSYKYTCSETGEIGSGSACNGKYIKCNCTDGYDLIDGACICNNNYKFSCYGTGYSSGSGEACGGKYTACTCATNYTWNGNSCICDSSFKYTCSGTGYSSGSGTSCNGKYKSCTCSTNYAWNGSICKLSCSSSYKYTCSGTGYAGGSGASCGGKYTVCTCINDGTSCYVWNGSACTKGTCATGSLEPETPGTID